MDFSVIGDLVISFVMGNPKFVGFCAIAYMIGFGAKIVRSAIEQFVAASPSKSDDIKLEEIKASQAFKVISFVLDLFLRFKKPDV